MEEWILNECLSTDFGDLRLSKRYYIILKDFSTMPMQSIPSSCGGWTETTGAYRFLHNPSVTPERIFSEHIVSTRNRIKNVDTILLIQDSTSIDYTGNRISDKVGHLENSNHRGLILHSTIAVTPDYVNLGNFDFDMWTRDINDIGKKSKRKQLPIEEKESYYWLKSYQASNQLAQEISDTRVISIGDREYDIYEVFEAATAPDSRAHLITRAAQDRRVALSNAETSLLWQTLESSKELGTKEILVPKTKAHEARESVLSIRAERITLKAPYRKGKKLKDLQLSAVLAVETNPPSETDKVEWLLLTTLEINNLNDALEIVEYYSIRWQIEMYFKILKSGCDIEKLQLETIESIENAIAIYMIVAWRIQYILMLNRQCPDLPADVIFSESEWKAMYIIKEKPFPEVVPSLQEVVLFISMQGGFLNRKGDKGPGVKTFWTGLIKLAHYSMIYEKIVKRKDVYNC